MLRRIRTIVALAVLSVASLGLTPANAAGATTCQIVATVTLSQPENLALVNGGTGTLSANFACEGTIAGTALNSPGTFAFCSHTSTSHSIQCGSTAPPDQPSVEQFADAIGDHGPVVSHVVADITLALNTGVSCSMHLNGHTFVTQATLNIPSMTCSGGFVANTARADAASQIVIDPTLNCTPGPGGAKACFQQLTFIGSLSAIDN